MLVGADNIVKYLNQVGCKHFRIYRGQNVTRQPDFEYGRQSANDTTDTCVSAFQQWAELQSYYTRPILYTMTVYPNGKKQSATDEAGDNPKGTFRTEFYLVPPDGGNFPARPGQMGMSGVTQESIGAIEQRIYERLETKMRLEQAEEYIDEIRYLQKKVDPSSERLDKALVYLGPYEPGIMDRVFGPPAKSPVLAGPDDPRVQDVKRGPFKDAEDQRRFNAAIHYLFNTAGLTVADIEAIVQMHKDQPGVFSMFVNMQLRKNR